MCDLKRIDVRLALAALRIALVARQPPPVCIHHSDRGSQYAAEDYRAELAKHGLRGSKGRRGDPYDIAMAESFMKTLKVEEVYLMEYDTFDDVAGSLPPFIEDVYNAKRRHSALGYKSPIKFEEPRPADGHLTASNLSTPRGALHSGGQNCTPINNSLVSQLSCVAVGTGKSAGICESVCPTL